MPPQTERQARTPDRRLQWLGLSAIVLALFLLAAPLVVGQLIRRSPRLAPTTGVAEPWPTAPATFAPVILGAAAPPRRTAAPLTVPEWRKLNHLTTIEFTTSSIVMQERTADYEDLLRSLPVVGDTFLPTLGKDVVTDRLIMKAVGKVQLGVDLAQIDAVQVTGSRISFRLPQPTVVAVELLPDQSQIFTRQQIWFLSQYAGLENAALEQARTQLRSEVAANPDFIKLAAEMARLQLTEFLRKAGFTTVEITFQ